MTIYEKDEQELADFREKHLRIDRSALDDALEDQPFLYAQVCEKVASTRATRDLLKLYYEKEKAKVIEDLREEDPKISEARANREADADEDLAALRREIVQKTNILNQWVSIGEAFSQKSHALTALANLYASAYFAKDGVSVVKDRKPRKTADDFVTMERRRIK